MSIETSWIKLQTNLNPNTNSYSVGVEGLNLSEHDTIFKIFLTIIAIEKEILIDL